MLISEIAILCCKFGRRPPTNYILLLVFTLSEGYLVSLICSAVGQQDGKEIVLMAAIMTLGMRGFNYFSDCCGVYVLCFGDERGLYG